MLLPNECFLFLLFSSTSSISLSTQSGNFWIHPLITLIVQLFDNFNSHIQYRGNTVIEKNKQSWYKDFDRYSSFWSPITLIFTDSIEQIPSWEVVTHLNRQFLALYGTRYFIIVFTIAHQWSLFWFGRIQYTPCHHIPLKSLLILFYHLRQGFSSGLFPWDYLPKFSTHFSSLSCMHIITCPTHLIFLDLNTLYIWWSVQ
jgi:hypothetical protein